MIEITVSGHVTLDDLRDLIWSREEYNPTQLHFWIPFSEYLEILKEEDVKNQMVFLSFDPVTSPLKEIRLWGALVSPYIEHYDA